jgi:hypothetical protein
MVQFYGHPRALTLPEGSGDDWVSVMAETLLMYCIGLHGETMGAFSYISKT